WQNKAIILWRIYADDAPARERLLADLIRRLTSSTLGMHRQWAAGCLGKIGAEAQASLPALLRSALLDEVRSVRRAASAAIEQIAPEAAAEAGLASLPELASSGEPYTPVPAAAPSSELSNPHPRSEPLPGSGVPQDRQQALPLPVRPAAGAAEA